MIWYLLSPLRGTSEPPKVASDNVIRRAFYRHGALAARYWLSIMLASVAIGVILSYPTVFMPDFPSIGSSGFPQHVWSGSVTTQDDLARTTDLEMRQIWLQGQYMQALNKSAIDHAFHIQAHLLGSKEGVLSTNSGLVSPTNFWLDDYKAFVDDNEPLTTVNDFDGNASIFEMNVKPFSTFAGKYLRHGRLIEADALVLTLITRNKDESGRAWDVNLRNLTSMGSWAITDGELGQSSIYEYLYQPLSFRQYFALAGAYLCMAIYTITSLKRLKAFRSRAGLVVTAITQMTTSILASFTICGLLRINLAQIPQEAYPFVVLTIGLENIFRLINAVLAYPPEMVTNQRIANGLADIGAATLASAVQNLALLWLLSLFVSPGVAAFCVFASVALLFDYFFLITFFVAVLNVDIKRLELQDSITRPSSNIRGRRTANRQSWVDAAIHGKVPFSTRMAGSITTVTFVMALNWHFSSQKISIFGRSISPSSYRPSTYSLPMLDFDRAGRAGNRTIHPSSWFQSRPAAAATAQFIQVLRPGLKSYTARIFNPIVLTIKGADRADAPDLPDSILIAIRELAIRHFYPFALAVTFVVAFVTVLMNFLLWNERVEAAETEMIILDDGPLTARTKSTTHKLDIVHLASAGKGNSISVALDRSICLTTRANTMQISPALLPGQETLLKSSDMWPVEAATQSTKGHQAILGPDGSVFTRSDETDGWLATHIRTDSSAAMLLFDFVVKTVRATEEYSVLHLTQDGVLTEIDSRGNQVRLELAPDIYGVSAAAVLNSPSSSSSIIVLTGLGLLVKCGWNTEIQSWMISEPARNQDNRAFVSATDTDTTSIITVNGLAAFIITTQESVIIVQSQSLRVLANIPLDQARQRSVRVIHSTPSRCPKCDGPACTIFGIAYTSLDGRLIVSSYIMAPTEDGRQPVICFLRGTHACMRALPDPITTELLDPGKWEITSLCCIAGIRPRAAKPRSSSFTRLRRPNVPSTFDSPLRRRRRESASEATILPVESYWEAYTLTHLGTYHYVPIKDLDDAEGQLFTTELGPVTRMSGDTVAVAVGNNIVLVKVRENTDMPLSEDGHGHEPGLETGSNTRTNTVLGAHGVRGGTPGLRRAGSRGRRSGGVLALSRRRAEAGH